jgi:hypothetical protein
VPWVIATVRSVPPPGHAHRPICAARWVFTELFFGKFPADFSDSGGGSSGMPAKATIR